MAGMGRKATFAKRRGWGGQNEKGAKRLASPTHYKIVPSRRSSRSRICAARGGSTYGGYDSKFYESRQYLASSFRAIGTRLLGPTVSVKNLPENP